MSRARRRLRGERACPRRCRPAGTPAPRLGSVRQLHRVLGQAELFTVPMHGMCAGCQMGEQWIVRIGDLDSGYSDLGAGCRRDGSPAAFARSCAPRQMPSIGTSRAIARCSQAISSASGASVSASLTLIGPPMKIAPRTVAGSGRRAPGARRAVLCSTVETPEKESRMRCGPSQGTCWTTSRGGCGVLRP